MVGEWQPIETAPKHPVFDSGPSQYGPEVLGTDGDTMHVTRWWQSKFSVHNRGRNWLDDGGNAWRPTHWIPLPDPPTAEDLSRDAALAELARLTQEFPE